MPPEASRLDRDTAGLIAARIAEQHFGTGPLAELRRLDPGGCYASSALQRLLIQYVASEDDESLRVWVLFIHCTALATPQSGERLKLGRALFEAGFKEGRLSRLLAVGADGMADAMPRAIRFLHAKGVTFMPIDLWDFLHAVMTPARDAARADAARTRLARAYYQAEDASLRTPSPKGQPT